jgi:glycosyltransferase involved in cell wall biosynthesis
MDNTKKRVLHISHTDIRTDSRILKEMRSAQIEGYHIFGIGIDTGEQETSSDAEHLTITSIRLLSQRLRYIPKILRHFLTFIELYIKAISICFKLKPHIVHCHDTLVLPIGVSFKIRRSCKLIYDAHELESDRNGITTLLRCITIIIEWVSWKKIDGLITVSLSIEKWYKKKYGPKMSAVVLNSPQMESVVKSPSNYLRDKFNIPKHESIYIYVGMIASGRGINHYLNYFSTAETDHLIFLGYGPLKERLLSKTASLNNIHFHEPVDHSAVVPIIQSADVGLCLIENISLSDYLCLPNKLFEYAFAGLPVIASNFPEIEATVRKYGLGETCEPTARGFEGAVGLRNKENTRGRVNLATLHDLSWPQQASNMVNLYRRLEV